MGGIETRSPIQEKEGQSKRGRRKNLQDQGGEGGKREKENEESKNVDKNDRERYSVVGNKKGVSSVGGSIRIIFLSEHDTARYLYVVGINSGASSSMGNV